MAKFVQAFLVITVWFGDSSVVALFWSGRIYSRIVLLSLETCSVGYLVFRSDVNLCALSAGVGRRVIGLGDIERSIPILISIPVYRIF